MSVNPVTPDRERVERRLAELAVRRDDLATRVARYASTDGEKLQRKLQRAALEMDRLARDRQSARTDVTAARQELEGVQRARREAVASGRRSWSPKSWFDPEARASRTLADQLGEQEDLLVQRVKSATSAQRTATRRCNEKLGELDERQQHLRWFLGFDMDAAQAELDVVGEELAILALELDVLRQREVNVERHIRPFCEAVETAEEELARESERASATESRLSEIESHMEEVAEMRQRLAHTTGYESRLIHDECERQFGTRKPDAAQRALQRESEECHRLMKRSTLRMERMERDRAKHLRRLQAEAAKAARIIRAVVIDGSNLSYDNASFIGVEPAFVVAGALQGEYAVTLVFDDSTRAKAHASAASLQQRLPGVDVHVTAPRTSADEALLRLADGREDVWVVSNDRFVEHFDRDAVKNRRLLTHEVFNGRVIVADLDVNVAFAAVS